jgi:hypothetical protein
MKKLYFYQSIYKQAETFLPFLSFMNRLYDNEIKNIKISKEVHDILKKYCDKKGVKIYKFIESIILEKCKEKKDIYGED